MGIPLVRNNSVDDINTSIIAIKKEMGNGNSMNNVNVNVNYNVTDTVEDGNSLPVTSQGVYDYVEGQGFTPVDEVAKNNMKAVTSNAVAECLKYSSGETFTGKVFIDENGVEHKIYKRVYYSATNWPNNTVIDTISNIAIVFRLDSITVTSGNQWHPVFNGGSISNYAVINLNGSLTVTRTDTFSNSKPSVVIVEYSKTTD